jgi:hypothetical protein
MDPDEGAVNVTKLGPTWPTGNRSRETTSVTSGEVIASTAEARAQAPTLKGVWRIVCFCGVVMALIVLVDKVVTLGLLQVRTGEFGVWNKIVGGKIHADIVIAGSSRARSHYDPRIIQEKVGRSAFNIGLNGSQTDMQVARFKTYLAHNTKPSLLIFNMDLFAFQLTHGGVYDPGQYVPYLGEAAIYEALTRINQDTWKARYVPLYGYAVEDLRFTWLVGALRLLGVNPIEDHFLGFHPHHSAWTGDFERFKDKNPEGVQVPIEADGIREIEDMLELCRRVGIPVLLVYSPEYIEMQALTGNRWEIFKRYHNLAERFGVPLWDYSKSPISSHRENFFNSQHLNAQGAAEFSRDLAERIACEQLLRLDSLRDLKQCATAPLVAATPADG